MVIPKGLNFLVISIICQFPLGAYLDDQSIQVQFYIIRLEIILIVNLNIKYFTWV